jgi:hypothetical protein
LIFKYFVKICRVNSWFIYRVYQEEMSIFWYILYIWQEYRVRYMKTNIHLWQHLFNYS